MKTTLLDCYHHEKLYPDEPCSNSISSVMRGLYIRQLVDLKTFYIKGVPTLSFFITEKGKCYVEENLLGNDLEKF